MTIERRKSLNWAFQTIRRGFEKLTFNDIDWNVFSFLFFNLIRTWQEDKKASLQGVPLKSLVFGLRRPSVSCFLGRILQESPRRKRKEQELLERRWSSIFHRSKKRVEQLLSSLWGCYRSAGTKKRNWRKKRCNHFHFMNTIEAS